MMPMNAPLALSRLFLYAAFAGLAAAGSLAPARALATTEMTPQLVEKMRDICAAPIAAAEARHKIPGQLLTAISHAESGRWDDGRKEIFAWPWTVTSGKRSWFFPTRMAAVEGVMRLKKEGVTNIDVGCMQVNLGWHGTAFMSVADALDPRNNVAYAARFLKDLFDERRSWSLAVGLYHSATPEFRDPYRRKVIRLWNDARRAAAKRHREEVMARLEAERRERRAMQLRIEAELAAGGPLP